MLKCLVRSINQKSWVESPFSYGMALTAGQEGQVALGTRIGVKEGNQLFSFTMIAIKCLLQKQEHKIRATDALEIILI